MTTLTPAPHISDGPGAMTLLDILYLGRYLVQRLFPGDAFKAVSHAFQRVLQPFRVILKVSNVRSFPANKTLRTGTFPVRPDFQDLTAFGNDFQAAVLGTKHT